MVCIVCENVILDFTMIGKCSLCNGHFHRDCGNINQEICNICQKMVLDEMFKKGG